MSPVRVRSEPGLGNSKETHLAWTGHPNAALCPTEQLGSFFWDSTFIFFWYLNKVNHLISRNIYVPCLAIPRMFLLITLLMTANFLFLLRVVICKERKNQQRWRLNWFLFLLVFWKNGIVKFSRKQLLVDRISRIIFVWYFHFSYLWLFLGGKYNCLHAKSGHK